MDRATAYYINGEVLLHPSSRTTVGVWILSEPVTSCVPTRVLELRENILNALDQSKDNVRHPTNWKGLFAPILKMSGTKTLGEFMRLAKCVEIDRQGDLIVFTPTRNLGVKEGFEPINERSRQITCEKVEHLGDALVAAFGDTE